MSTKQAPEQSKSSILKYEILGIVMVAAGIFLLAGLFGQDTGPVGAVGQKVLRNGFGVGAFGVPLIALLLGVRYISAHRQIIYSQSFWGYMSLLLGFLAIFHHFKTPAGQEILPESLPPGGGLVGGMIVFIVRRFFAFDGTTVVLLAFIMCALLVATRFSLAEFFTTCKNWIQKINFRRTQEVETVTKKSNVIIKTAFEEAHQINPSFYNHESDRPKKNKQETVSSAPVDIPPIPVAATESTSQSFVAPPLSLLKKVTVAHNPRREREINDHARILEKTLDNFGIQAKVVHATQGPTVTRYELEPAPGVKISRIVSLSDDIALKLAAPAIRIEAPIPGKAVIGIEVPNRETFAVTLREVLESSDFQSAKSPLTVTLGKDIAGETILADLAKMPHLLVAGATGSGKSVCINTLIISLLYKSHPDHVKLLLVDPKVVELSNYKDIPHLLTPVVTESKRAASALKWAVQEMERRYTLFAAAGVRDIAKYNEMNPGERIPWIVIIIDELADLMMVAPVDVEDAICRLAQMARAAGLHLVIATQRPSVDVITGTIKANIPSRISFAVSSQIDSRTILDMAGAEKLLGKGDMLFYPVGASKPVRVQGAFVSDEEIEAVIQHLKIQAQPAPSQDVPQFEVAETASPADRFEDELLEDAVRHVLDIGQASVSMLQRKFRVGYSRAARLIDTMEEMHIVSSSNGSKPREITMTSDQVFIRYFKDKARESQNA